MNLEISNQLCTGAQKSSGNNGLYLKEIPEILSSLIEDAKSETLVKKAKDLLSELSYTALKLLTNEQEIVIEEKKDPSFDQLLGALMKVLSPKK